MGTIAVWATEDTANLIIAHGISASFVMLRYLRTCKKSLNQDRLMSEANSALNFHVVP